MKMKISIKQTQKIYGVLIFMLFILWGCKQSIDIKVVAENNFSITTEAKTSCMFIETINNQAVTPNTNFEQYGIKCMPLDFSKPQYNATANIEVNGKIITKTFNILDLASPKITAQDKYEIKKNTFINIKDLYSIDDNYDKNPEVNVEGFYNSQVVGEYLIKITAKDASNNTANKEIVINVVEFTQQELLAKKEAEAKQSAEKPQQAPQTSNRIVNRNSTTTPTKKQIVPVQPVKKGVYKTFLFTDGYTMKNVYQACYNHLISIGSGECTPLKKGDTYTGYEYKP